MKVVQGRRTPVPELGLGLGLVPVLVLALAPERVSERVSEHVPVPEDTSPLSKVHSL